MMKTIFLGFLINICNISLTLILPVACIWSKFILLCCSSFILFLKAVFNFIIPKAAFSSSEELIGEVAPGNNSFLIFGKKSTSATFKMSTKLSRGTYTIYALWPSACVCVVPFFFFVSFGNFHCSIDWTIFWLPKRNEILHLPFHFCILENNNSVVSSML